MLWNILISNCKVMLVTLSAAVAYVTRWSTESGKHRGKQCRGFFYSHLYKITYYSMAVVSVTYYICFYLYLSEREVSFFFFFFCSRKGRGDVTSHQKFPQTCSSKRQRNKKCGCLQLYRHSFICMRCLNMPLRAEYICFIFSKHPYRCKEQMSRWCRKR